MGNQEKPKRLERKTLYESEWLNLHRDQVLLPAGRLLEQYHIIEMKKDSIASIVVNKEEEILLVKTPRYPTDSIEWEAPAGFLENENEIFEGAYREILEETGLGTKNHKLIYKYYPVNGISDSLTYVICCEVTDEVKKFDRNETIEIKWFAIEELKEMIAKNLIMSGPTLIALLHFMSPDFT